jgi:predicted chitinase
MTTGVLEQKSLYNKGDYVYGDGKGKDTDGDGKKEIDCSTLVWEMLKTAGYKVPYNNTTALKINVTNYDVIEWKDVLPGDIALWPTHTGFVEDIDVENKSGNFFGSQNSTGPATAKFGTGSNFWPMPIKFLRVKEIFKTGSQPASTPEPAPVTPPAPTAYPLMNFQYPFRKSDGTQFKDSEEIFKALESEGSGNFLLGNHGFWHGGIHISHRVAPQCMRDEPIRCIGDGVVVAYRLNENYLATAFEASNSTEALKYSNSFCLVRHDYKSLPNKEVTPSTKNELVFYSLYMHLLPYESYSDDTEQVGAPKIKMVASGFKARSDILGATGCVEYGSISAGTEIEILEEHDDHVHAKGKLIKGTVGGRTLGQDFWFAYKQNGIAYLRGDGSASWNAITAPERKKPDYWKGKVRAVVSGTGLTLREAPSPQSHGALAGAALRQVNSLGQNAELVLCTNSIIEFDSGKVFSLKIGSKLFKMAECSFVPNTSGTITGLKSHSAPVPATFWACVEKPYVQLQGLIPTEFDKVVPMDTAIKAGDTIGYLGLNETLAGTDGGISRSYQVHVEIFSADPKIEDFLKNKADVKQGKQYLHLPASTILKSKPPQTGVVKISNENFVELGKAVLYKDTEEWYEITIIDDAESKTGLLKKEDAKLLSQHDWEKLGFRVVKESNSNSDGFLDPGDMPEFFQTLYKDLDRFGNKDQKVTPEDFPIALKNVEFRNHWSRLVAYHPTEWKSKSDSAKWARLDTLLEDSPSVLKHEKERIDSLVFWDDPVIQSKGLGDGVIWHFHPIAFLSNFIGGGCCELTLESFKTIFGNRPLFTADNMSTTCSSYNVEQQRFVDLLNAAFKKFNFTDCRYKIHFLSQCYHESDKFATTREYASGNDYDLATYPASMCTLYDEGHKKCKRHRQILAEGNTTIGDGPKYKGRGIMQVTWKGTYQKYKDFSGVDCIGNPEILSEEIEHAVNASVWFWVKYKNLNARIDQYYDSLKNSGKTQEEIDAEVVRLVTRKVNGGATHLAERQQLFKKINEAMK